VRNDTYSPSALRALALWVFFEGPHRLGGRGLFHCALLALATGLFLGNILRGGNPLYFALWALAAMPGKCACSAVDARVAAQASDFLLLQLLDVLGTVAWATRAALPMAVGAFYIAVYVPNIIPAVQIAFPDAFCALSALWTVYQKAWRLNQVRLHGPPDLEMHLSLGGLFHKIGSYTVDDFAFEFRKQHTDHGRVARLILWWLGFPV
jgi:hypothetical protein